MADGNTINPVGRPPIIDDLKLQKLREAFLIGATDEEACSYAEISMATLYNYQKDNPEFLDKKKQYKQNPFMKARTTIYKGLDAPPVAQWFMERKKSDEFGNKDKKELANVTNNVLIIGDDKLSELLYGFTKKLTESPAPVIEGEQK